MGQKEDQEIDGQLRLGDVGKGGVRYIEYM